VIETVAVPDDHPTRGIGALDLARAIREGRSPRASVALGLHVLEVMSATLASAESGSPVDVASSVEPAAPLEHGWDAKAVTLAG
jgi:predicted dehydrogenase